MNNLFQRVDKKLLPVKCHYFLFMAGLAGALPFRTVFAKQLGISATAVGVIFCAVPFLKVVSNPLCGFVIDYFKRFRLTISLIMFIVTFTHVIMIFIPPRTMKYESMVPTTLLDEKLFRPRLGYACFNRTFSGGENIHSVLFYTDYSHLQYPFEETGTFLCDMECSGLRGYTNFHRRKEKKEKCHRSLTFLLTITGKISSYNVDIKLRDGTIFSECADYPVISEFNESSITSFTCWSSFFNENCSSGLQAYNNLVSNRFNQDAEEENNQPSSDELDFGEDSSGMSENTFKETQMYFEKGKVNQYYTLYKYIIKSQTEVCTNGVENDCFIKWCTSNVSRTDDRLEGDSYTQENEYISVQFWSFFILVVLSSVAYSAIMFTMDAICYEMLKEKKGNYGHQRLWGSMGWGLGALAGGYLNEIISPDSEDIDYTPGFYLLAALTIVDLIPVYNLEVTDVKYSSHIWKDVCFLFSNGRIVYNIIVVFFIGSLSGFIWNYQFWFMEEIGASQVLLGLSQTFECLFEIPWFLVSGWIIQKIGHVNSNNIALLCFGLRYLAFAFMHNAWLTLPVSILSGPTFGLFFSSMTMYAKEEAPPGTEATVQSLLHTSFEGLGVAAGSFLGGVGIDHFGSQMAFMYAASISFILLFINIVFCVWSSRSKKKLQKLKDDNDYPLQNR